MSLVLDWAIRGRAAEVAAALAAAEARAEKAEHDWIRIHDALHPTCDGCAADLAETAREIRAAATAAEDALAKERAARREMADVIARILAPDEEETQ